MSDVSESELISAYLDGELTADEQVRAEQILASSAEARQLLEELRALSGTLQSLPQEKLDEDLGPRVLQVAERRMLSPEEPNVSGTLRVPIASGTQSVPDTGPSAGRAAASLTSRGNDSSPSEDFPWRELSWRGMLSPRALIWSAIVVVVGIIIHFNAPPQNVNHEQARLDKGKPAAAAGDKTAESRKKSNVEPSWRAPADAPKEPGATDIAKKVAKADDRRMAVAKSELARVADDKAAEGTRDHEQLDAGKSERRDFSMKAMKPAPDKDEAPPERIAKESALEESKAGPTAPGTPMLSERSSPEKSLPVKPAGEPVLAAGEKPPSGNIAAHGGEVESQSRLMRREDDLSKAADGLKAGEGVVAGKDAAGLGRGEGGGGGRGGRFEGDKKQLQSKIAANEPPPPAAEAPSPVAAPAAAAAPMAAPALTGPPLTGPPLTGPALIVQKAGTTELLVSNVGGGKTAAVINFNCSTAAARNGTFDKVLRDNGVAAATPLDNYSQQSVARYQNFKADNSGLSPGGVQMPLSGTASLGSTGRQQQAAQQQAVQQPPPNYNRAQREVAENSASRNAPQALNMQPSVVTQSRGAATNDNSLNNSLSGSNSYGQNSAGPSSNGTVSAGTGSNGPSPNGPSPNGPSPNGPSPNGTGAFGGGAQAAMADNTTNGYNAVQQGGMGNQSSFYRQGPARSANPSNLGGALNNSMSPTITYEVEASPAQLAGVIKQIRQDREAFSSPYVPPALEQELLKANGRSGGGGGGLGGIAYQYKDQSVKGAEQTQIDPAGGGQLQGPRGKPAQADAKADRADKLHEQNPNAKAGAAPAGLAQSQSAPVPASQPPVAAGMTRVVFVLNVVDRVVIPPLVPAPAPAAPPAGK